LLRLFWPPECRSAWGRLKPLLPFGDQPMIARVVETLQGVGDIHPIIVVTGNAASQIEDALREASVQFAHNSNFAAGGMLSSVQTGVRALPLDVDAFFLVLGRPAGGASEYSASPSGGTATNSGADCLTNPRGTTWPSSAV
jgi:hypothetical protein